MAMLSSTRELPCRCDGLVTSPRREEGKTISSPVCDKCGPFGQVMHHLFNSGFCKANVRLFNTRREFPVRSVSRHPLICKTQEKWSADSSADEKRLDGEDLRLESLTALH
jgi:hypothetical protein